MQRYVDPHYTREIGGLDVSASLQGRELNLHE